MQAASDIIADFGNGDESDGDGDDEADGDDDTGPTQAQIDEAYKRVQKALTDFREGRMTHEEGQRIVNEYLCLRGWGGRCQ